jgi:hypothetical protein
MLPHTALLRRTARVGLALTLATLATLAAPAAARAELPPLIPRDLLFGNPERAAPQLSPDGKRLAWLAPDAGGILQVWVQTLGKDDARAVTADAKRPVRMYFWAEDDKTLLYQQDQGGDENFHVYAVNLDDGNVRDLTPWQGVRAEVVSLSDKLPTQILVTLNLRSREIFDVYRVDLVTGAVTFDTENPGDVAGWIADAKLVVRGAQAIMPDGGFELRVRDGQTVNCSNKLTAGAQDYQ